MALPPAFRMAAIVSSAGAGSISLTTTEAPSAASFFAEAAPMPRPEPVTIATFPSIMPIVRFLLLVTHRRIDKQRIENHQKRLPTRRSLRPPLHIRGESVHRRGKSSAYRYTFKRQFHE